MLFLGSKLKEHQLAQWHRIVELLLEIIQLFIDPRAYFQILRINNVQCVFNQAQKTYNIKDSP